MGRLFSYPNPYRYALIQEEKMKTKLTGAEIFWEMLIHEGVEVIFGYPGAGNMPIYDAMGKYPAVHHVLVRHEQGAAHAADGYARASGKVGVALSTSGPGATNLVTGITNAMMDSIPTVFFTGQVASHLIGYDAFQEADVTGITLPITKHNYLVTDIEELSDVIKEAFHLARTGRPGPVLIDLAKNVQTESMEWEYDPSPVQLPGYRPDLHPSEEDLALAVQMIRQAERPLILAGHGVLISGAMEELRWLAETTHTPIATTLLGLGCFPASHPLNLGMMGMHGAAWVNHAIQEADLILAMGMRFSDRVTGNLKTYAQKARKIHFEIDLTEINKNVKVDLPLIGDLRDSLTQINGKLPALEHTAWLAFIQEIRSDSTQRDIQNTPDNGSLHAPHVIHDLWKHTGGNAIVVTDVGQHQMWTAQYYKHEQPNTWITSGGLGTMGFGLPAAMGAKFAKPDAEVWLVAGDGGFQMTQMELQTLRQEGLKINIAVINNNFLGMVRQWQELFFEKRYYGTPITSPDFAMIAKAHGLAGRQVTQRAEGEEAIQWAREQPGTALIEFQVEAEDLVYPMVPAGAGLHQMLRRPLKD
jgi:acetolactate synthase I/II/III large subunit